MKKILVAYFISVLLISGCDEGTNVKSVKSKKVDTDVLVKELSKKNFSDGSKFCSDLKFIKKNPRLAVAYCKNDEMIQKRFQYKKAYSVLAEIFDYEDFMEKLIELQLILAQKNTFARRSDEASFPRVAIKKCRNSKDQIKCISDDFQSREQKIIDWSQRLVASINEAGELEYGKKLAKKIDGDYYRGEEGIIVDVPNWKEGAGHHRFVLKPVSDSEIVYYLYIPFSNGHSCEREGVASYRLGDKFVEGKFDSEKPQELCTLEFFLRDGKVVINDLNGVCKMESCGQRGNLSQIEFDLKNRTGSLSVDSKLKGFYQARKLGKEAYFLMKDLSSWDD